MFLQCFLIINIYLKMKLSDWDNLPIAPKHISNPNCAKSWNHELPKNTITLFSKFPIVISSVKSLLSETKKKFLFVTLTVNSPVTASKPTCTVCSKFVGYEMLGLESLWDCFDLILFFNVFFLRSSSGSEKK